MHSMDAVLRLRTLIDFELAKMRGFQMDERAARNRALGCSRRIADLERDLSAAMTGRLCA